MPYFQIGKTLARLVRQGWEMQMGLNKAAQLTAHSIFQAQVEKGAPLRQRFLRCCRMKA